MSDILWWMVQNTVVVVLLVAFVLPICRLLRNRPALCHALWLVVLVKFVTPPLAVWPWSLAEISDRAMQFVPTDEAVSVEASCTGESLLPSLSDSLSDEVVADSFVPSIDLETVDDLAHGESLRTSPVQTPQSADSESLPIGEGRALEVESLPRWGFAVSVLCGLWLMGCVSMAGVQLRRMIRQRAIVLRGTSAPTSVTNEVASVAKRLGMHPVRTLVVEGLRSPFVWCVGWLRLVWPSAMTDGEQLIRSRGIIAHELAHVRRRDHWIAWLELAAGIIWWWNPLFWFVRGRLREMSEMACDAIALSVYDDREEYAESFLALSSSCKTGAPASVLGVSTGTPSSFERRLTMILNERVSGKLSVAGMLLCGCIAAFALPGWSLAQADDEAPPATTNDALNGNTPAVAEKTALWKLRDPSGSDFYLEMNGYEGQLVEAWWKGGGGVVFDTRSPEDVLEDERGYMATFGFATRGPFGGFPEWIRAYRFNPDTKKFDGSWYSLSVDSESGKVTVRDVIDADLAAELRRKKKGIPLTLSDDAKVWRLVIHDQLQRPSVKRDAARKAAVEQPVLWMLHDPSGSDFYLEMQGFEGQIVEAWWKNGGGVVLDTDPKDLPKDALPVTLGLVTGGGFPEWIRAYRFNPDRKKFDGSWYSLSVDSESGKVTVRDVIDADLAAELRRKKKGIPLTLSDDAKIWRLVIHDQLQRPSVKRDAVKKAAAAENTVLSPIVENTAVDQVLSPLVGPRGVLIDYSLPPGVSPWKKDLTRQQAFVFPTALLLLDLDFNHQQGNWPGARDLSLPSNNLPDFMYPTVVPKFGISIAPFQETQPRSVNSLWFDLPWPNGCARPN